MAQFNGPRHWSPRHRPPQPMPPTPNEGHQMVTLDQHVIRYLRATNYILKKIEQRNQGVTIRIEGDVANNFFVVLHGQQPKFFRAEKALRDHVETLFAKKFSLSVDSLEYLKCIKHSTVIRKFREIKVRAAWCENIPDEELSICSDCEENGVKAFNAIQEVIAEYQANGGTKQSSDNSNKKQQMLQIRPPAIPSLLNPGPPAHLYALSYRHFLPHPYYPHPNEWHPPRMNGPGNIHFLPPNMPNNPSFQGPMQRYPTDFEAQQQSPHSNTEERIQDELEVETECLGYLKEMKQQVTDKINKKLDAPNSIQIEMRDSIVEIKGWRNKDVCSAMKELKSYVGLLVMTPFLKTEEFIKCFQSIKKGNVNQALKSSQVRAGWDTRNGSLWICSDSKSNVEKAEDVINNMINESRYPETGELLSQAQKTAIATKHDEWEAVRKEIKKSNPGIVLNLSDDSSHIRFALPVSGNGNKLSVSHRLDGFFSPLKMQHRKVLVKSTDETNLCLKNRDRIAEKCQLQGGEYVSIEVANQIATLSSTSQASLDFAEKQFSEMLVGITTDSFKIKKLALLAWMKSTSAKSKLEDVSQISHTVYKMFRQPQAAPRQLISTQTSGKLSTAVGDISQISFDGILTSRGALSLRVEQLSGYSLLEGSQKCAINGRLVSVYHLNVGHWNSNTSLQELESNTWIALEAFAQEGLRTIALPAIGTGNLGFPSSLVADSMINATVEYLEANPQTSIQQVIFVIYKQDDIYQAFHDKLTKLKTLKIKTRNVTRVGFTGLTQADVEKAMSTFQADMNALLVTDRWTRSPNSELIKKLSTQQIEKIKNSAIQRNVDVTVDLSQPDIVIEGLHNDVSKMREDIDVILHSLADHANAIPPNWDKEALSKGIHQVVLDLARDKAEYDKVRRLFFHTCKKQGITIIQISRIQNEHLYAQYKAQTERVRKELGVDSSVPVKRRLWHGTTAETVNLICTQEFNRSYAGKNGVAYGQGCYFATTSNYSINYSQDQSEKYIILAKVATGRYKLGNSSTERKNLPPGYHSTVDSEASPSIFVVYHDAAAYPEYVIKFK